MTPWRSRMLALLGIEPQELPLVLRLGTLFALTVFALLLGRTVRDAMFLNAGLADKLPWMYVGVAVIVVLSALIMRRLGDRFSAEKLAHGTVWVFAATFVALYFALQAGGSLGHGAIYALYLWVEVLTSMLIMQFWLLANTLFHPRQAKRLYSLITSGQVFGNLLCGAVAGLFAHTLGTVNLLWVLIGTLLLIRLFMGGIGSVEASQGSSSTGNTGKTVAHKDPPAISKYIVSIGILTVLTYLTTSLVDFQFKVVAKSHYSADDLTSFFGIFYGLVGSIAFFLQIFAANRIVRRVGLFGTLSIMPAGFILLSGGWLIAPILGGLRLLAGWISPALKFNENLFRYTLNDPLVQLLLIPLPARTKARAQSLTSGILKPLAMGGAGLLMMVLNFFFVKTGDLEKVLTPVGIAISVGALIWLLILLRIRKQYLNILASGAEAFSKLATPAGDLDQRVALQEIGKIFDHQDPGQILAALDLAEELMIELSVDKLSRLAQTPSLPQNVLSRVWLHLAVQDPERLLQLELPDAANEIRPLAILLSGASLSGGAMQLLLSSPDTHLLVQLVAATVQGRMSPAMQRQLLPLAVDAATDRLHQEPAPPARQFHRLITLLPVDNLIDAIEAELYRPTGQKPSTFLLTILDDAASHPLTAKSLAQNERWPEVLEKSVGDDDLRIVRAALRLAFQSDDPQPGLKAIENNLTLIGLWQATASPAAVWQRLASINREDPMAVEWWTRPAGKHIPESVPIDEQVVEAALDQAEVFLTAASGPALIRHSLEASALQRLAIAVRWVAWYARSETLAGLSRPMILDNPGRRANLAELVDQVLHHPLKERIAGLLEQSFDPQTDMSADLIKRLPFSPTEEAVRVTCLTLLSHQGDTPVSEIANILALAGVDLFSELPVQELRRIGEIAESMDFEADQAIITDGAEGDSLYLLTEGKVEVRKNGKTLVTLEPGVCFGEMALLDDQPRSADVVAADAVTCLRIDRDDFSVLLLDQPAISRSIMSVLTRRLRQANERAGAQS